MRFCPHSIPLILFIFLAVLCGPVGAQDGYEPDNTFNDGTIIIIHDETPQQHDLHASNDEDWIKFYALKSTTYQVEVTNVGAGVDPYIELFAQDGVTSMLDKTKDDNGNGGDETLLWNCDQEGIYYVKVGHVGTSTYGQGIGYTLELIYPGLVTLPGYLTGTIMNKKAHPVAGARIKVQNSSTGFRGSGISLPNGSYIVCLESGSCSIEVVASGYGGKIVSCAVPGTENIVLNTIPVAQPDQLDINKGETVSGNVLQNDADGDDDPLVAILDSDVSHGTLNFASNGQFTYTHDGGESRLDSFTYHAHDGSASSNQVKVSIFIGHMHLPCLLLLLN